MMFTQIEDVGGIDIRPPNVCPYCHNHIIAMYRGGHSVGDRRQPQDSKALELWFQCPNSDCNHSFLSYYRGNSDQFVFERSSVGVLLTRDFSIEINEVSPKFVEIYGQAQVSESYRLNHLSGIGYGKALEFLIKDYLLHINPELRAMIARKFLGKCIDEDVKNENVKKVAKRAAWLRNDESHYVRVFETKDSDDLKQLIDVVVSWIELEIRTVKAETEMPHSG